MSNSNRLKIVIYWRREDGQQYAKWEVHNGKEGRPIYMVAELLDYLKRHKVLPADNERKILNCLMEKKIVSPGAAILYGLASDPMFLRKMSKEAEAVRNGVPGQV